MKANGFGNLTKVLAAPLLAACMLMAGCQSSNVQSQSGGSAASGAATQISGIALPEGHSLDLNRTLILGDGDRWTGRLSYSINASADAMFDFMRREMLNYGWAEVAVVRAESSIMTYASQSTGRVATIQIDRRTIGGSRVEMTVVPGGSGAGNSPAGVPAPVRR